nr:hypothetical protein [Tanacetum cinerariifolium]
IGASGNSDDDATIADGAGKMGAVGISGVEVVVSDFKSSEHRKGETLSATDTGGGELLMDHPLTMNEYQAQAPRWVRQLQPPLHPVQPGPQQK